MKKQFTLYSLIGVLNTALHWVCFGVLYSLGVSQAISNLVGFLFASLFSFVVNSKVTFKKELHLGRYLVFVLGMAGISLGIGFASDRYELHPIVTLLSFSIISLIFGFLWSKYVVFKGDCA